MTPTLIMVPGWGGSGPDHWQRRWAEKYGAAWTPQDDWDDPQPEDWVRRLAEVVAATPGELVLVAHSLGVSTVALWAAAGGVPERVRGALLVAPPDLEQPGEAAGVLGRFRQPELLPLPFPALLVASENDPYARFERVEQLAERWEATLVTAGEAGHLGVASGHGDWPEGEVLLSEALHAWTPPEISRF